jgi:molybdopterin molybdotransferase
LRRLEALVVPRDPVEVDLTEALGMVLRADLFALFDLPRFTNSAMDGYAIRYSDTDLATRDTPVTLEVTDSVDAGQIARSIVPPGGALRIGTGAAVPASCDAVVPVEAVSAVGSTIALTTPVPRGANIRPRGEDIRAGDLAVAAGTRLRPQEIAMLAALGIGTVLAVPPPRVSIVSIGPELIAGAEPAAVPDANGPMLAALARSSGATIVQLAQSSGEPSALMLLLRELAGSSDLIFTSGGVSEGTADTLSQALATLSEIELWNLRLRPGKHYAAGRIAGSILLALPGNPVAAFVGFLLLGRPVIERAVSRPHPQPVLAIATEPLTGSSQRFDAIRGHAEAGPDSVLRVTPLRQRGSGVVSSLLAANCLALLPEGIERVDAGEAVEIRWVGYQ